MNPGTSCAGHWPPAARASSATAEQAHLLLGGIPAAVAGNLLIGLIAAMVLRGHIETAALLGWATTFGVVQVARLALWFVGLGRATSAAPERTWLRLLRAGALLSGLAWGALPVFLFPADLPHQVFLAFVTAGVTGAAVAALASDRVSALLFVVPVLVPLILRLFVEGGEIPTAMGTMVLLYLVYLAAAAHRGERAFHDTQALRERADRQNIQLREAQRLARLGAWSLDVPSGKLEWSEEVYAIYGRDPASFTPDMAAYYRELVHPDDVAAVQRNEQAAYRVPGRHHHIDHRVLMPDGTVHWVHVEGVALPDAAGRPARIVGMVQDITDRKKAEQLKNEFISTVSHELRTPLTSIRGSLGLLAGGAVGELSGKARELVHVAYNNSNRLTHLINDILDIEKIGSGKMQFDLRAQALMPLVERIVADNQTFAGQHGVSLKVSGHVEGEVVVDDARFGQVLTNLLSNAVKFSPAGAAVRVDVERRADCLRVSVTDRGPGVPAAFRARLFEKFSQADSSDTRARGGSGLGLAISKMLIEGMGGYIGFESEEGRGATFFVDLTATGGMGSAARAASTDPAE